MVVDNSTTLSPEEISREKDFVSRLKRGDESAFEELVRHNGPAMLAVISRLLKQEQDRQEVLQEAFLSAFKSLPKFAAESRLSTWLHRIAVNAALMRLRSKKSRPETLIEDLLPKFQSDGHRANVRDAWKITHDTAVSDAETKELVRKCIDQLPDQYRAILILRDIEERSTEETAELLDLSLPNVKTRLHRARQALRELLDRHFGVAAS